MNPDFVVVGSGMSGLAFARTAAEKGFKVLILEQRDHPGGMLHCRWEENVEVHSHGPHIFHTSSAKAWSFFSRFAQLDGFVNSPIAVAKEGVFSLPFSMYTFNQMWGVRTPEEAKAKLKEQCIELDHEPANLKEKALAAVGWDIYSLLIKGYTEKQWGRYCEDLPPWIIGRLPLRMTYDARYFSDRWQGLPIDGWNAFIDAVLCHPNISMLYGVDFFENRSEFEHMANRMLICTAPIDKFYGHSEGMLQWRTLNFIEERHEVESIYGAPVVNWPDKDVKWTRISEWKHFRKNECPFTIITKEIPAAWKEGMDPLYPIPTTENKELHSLYVARALKDTHVAFLGRQGRYRYLNIDQAIVEGIELAESLC